jgi:hypothetical protein
VLRRRVNLKWGQALLRGAGLGRRQHPVGKSRKIGKGTDLISITLFNSAALIEPPRGAGYPPAVTVLQTQRTSKVFHSAGEDLGDDLGEAVAKHGTGADLCDWDI